MPSKVIADSESEQGYKTGPNIFVWYSKTYGNPSFQVFSKLESALPQGLTSATNVDDLIQFLRD